MHHFVEVASCVVKFGVVFKFNLAVYKKKHTDTQVQTTETSLCRGGV